MPSNVFSMLPFHGIFFFVPLFMGYFDATGALRLPKRESEREGRDREKKRGHAIFPCLGIIIENPHKGVVCAL